MTPDQAMDRIRAADPSPAATITDQDLFARITASPGDPRLGLSGGTTPRRRRRTGSPGLVFIIAAVVLSASGGAFGAIQLGALSHASPKALFEADPAGQYSRLPGQITRGTGQTVIQRTVHLATTFTVPGVGKFEWWIALSRPNGWLCGAIRDPDGTWADLGPNNKYQLSGPVPGCGTLPWHDADGFAYNQTSIRSPNGEGWRIAYGYAPATGRPAQIRDKVSGASAPIGDRRYFAIVMPLCKPSTCGRTIPPGYQLQTLNAAGHVLSTDRFDPGE